MPLGRLLPLSGALALILLTACGSNSSTSTATTPTTAAPASTAATTAAPATTTAAPATTTPASPVTTTAGGALTVTVTVGTDSSPTRVDHVPLGAKVTLELTDPNAKQQYHLHGYDLESAEVPAGTTAKISFTADQAGTFEVESHETEAVLVQLEIS